nr:unnamed protein product [Callosobruchus chinensis]
MRFTLILLIASYVHFSNSQTDDDFIDCSVYKGLNITWKVKGPSILRQSDVALRFGVRAGSDSSDIPFFYHWDLGQPIPEEFDARQKWSNCESIKEIRDQGNCGSCWAVSSASAMSDRICIHSSGKNQERISALDLMACCEECSVGICEGGFLTTAFRYWATTGIVTGGEDNRNQTDVSMTFM